MNFIEGEIVYINKALHCTSFAVVNKFRYHLCRRLKVKKIKVGHAGTLDPLATGVMLLCTGKKTKMIEQLQQHNKEYLATVRLGATTASYDLETEIDHTCAYCHVTEGLLLAALKQFEGDIWQSPPAFSACKLNGERAYSLARKGEMPKIQPKKVRIEKIELCSFNLPDFTIRVTCGKGTYIRSLANDIGKALDSGAHLIALERTRVGEVGLEQCIPMEQIEQFIETNTRQ
jgi:tRNA pseudouridine55 synthase